MFLLFCFVDIVKTMILLFNSEINHRSPAFYSFLLKIYPAPQVDYSKKNIHFILFFYKKANTQVHDLVTDTPYFCSVITYFNRFNL